MIIILYIYIYIITRQRVILDGPFDKKKNEKSKRCLRLPFAPLPLAAPMNLGTLEVLRRGDGGEPDRKNENSDDDNNDNDNNKSICV